MDIPEGPPPPPPAASQGATRQAVGGVGHGNLLVATYNVGAKSPTSHTSQEKEANLKNLLKNHIGQLASSTHVVFLQEVSELWVEFILETLRRAAAGWKAVRNRDGIAMAWRECHAGALHPALSPCRIAGVACSNEVTAYRRAATDAKG